MKSLFYQENSPFSYMSTCDISPCRQEVTVTVRKDGRIYRCVLRDKVVPEDPYIMLLKATAFALKTGEAYNGLPPKRGVKDFLIKNNVVI